MSYRKRTSIIVLVIILAAAAELAYRWSNTRKTCVQIINQGDGTLNHLVVRYGKSRLAVGSLAPGQTTSVRLTPGARGSLNLDFDQKGNPVNGFEVPDFDPSQNLRDGFKLVLSVKNDAVERYMEDDEANPPESSLGDRIADWMRWAIANP